MVSTFPVSTMFLCISLTGVGHLEALELLSKECAGKVAMQLSLSVPGILTFPMFRYMACVGTSLKASFNLFKET